LIVFTNLREQFFCHSVSSQHKTVSMMNYDLSTAKTQTWPQQRIIHNHRSFGPSHSENGGRF